MTQTAAIQVVPNPTASRLDRLRCAVVALGGAGADRPLERQQQVQSSINLKVLLVLPGAGDGLGFGGPNPSRWAGRRAILAAVGNFTLKLGS